MKFIFCFIIERIFVYIVYVNYVYVNYVYVYVNYVDGVEFKSDVFNKCFI